MISCKADDAQLACKEAFFNKLQALNEISDEEDTNDLHQIIRKCRKPLQPAGQRTRTPSINRLPALQRAISAPVSVVKETSPLHRHLSLLREEITTPFTSSEASIVKETPTAPTPTNNRPQERRTVSTPAIGNDLILNHSTGIDAMLGKKAAPKGLKRKKSKEASIKLVPENERIFKDLTFYYVPPNDINPLRKARINKAREYGAVWPKKQWNADITHIIADRGVPYEEVMKCIGLETLPANIILVNEDYPLDCIKHKILVDATQDFYKVAYKKTTTLFFDAMPAAFAHQASDCSLEVQTTKAQSKNGTVEETPPRSQPFSQPSQSRENNQLLVDSALGCLEHVGVSFVDIPVEESDADEGPIKRQRHSFGDELDQCIELARGVQHLPLDNDDDDEEETLEGDGSRPGSRDAPEETDSEGERPQSRNGKGKSISKKNGGKGTFNQEASTCMNGGDGVTREANPNKHTIDVLIQMCEYYERTRDHWRETAYKKAISILKKQTIRITTFEQGFSLPSIGQRIADKIVEIVVTGRLQRLENAQAEPTDKFLQIFLNIYGVGIQQAGKWVQQGYQSLDDLLNKAKLTGNQRLGIDRYDDFLTRIPREEVTALGELVKSTAAGIDPAIKVTIGGSYRRGAKNSGDIDCLLTKAGTTKSRDLLPFLTTLVSTLTANGFLVAALATPSEAGSASKWHGCCVLPGSLPKPIWRRIDFLMVPETELGAALIYFTGDDIFNRSLRLLASRKGWRLNQRGLYRDVLQGPGRVKVNEGSLMEGANEKKIFELLGVPWRAPEHRICR